MKRPRDRTMRMVGATLLISFGSLLISIVLAYAGLLLAGTWGGIIGAFGGFFAGFAFYRKWIFPPGIYDERTMRMVGAVCLMVFGSILISIGFVYTGLLLAGTWGGVIGALGAFFAVFAFYEKWIAPVIYDEYEE